MRRAPVILLLVLVLLLQPAPGFRITEFCPDTWLPRDADSYFVLEGNGSLGNVSISDGEGTLAFPPGARAAGEVMVADEALAFHQTHGYLPDFEVVNTSPAVADMAVTGHFALANAGDELLLADGGATVQALRWPGVLQRREGQVHYLTGSGWDPRILLLGQSRFAPATFHNATVTGFVSPDSSLGVLEEAILSARSEILVNAYELSAPPVRDLLIAAEGRGVAVTVLLEGGPVGGIGPDEWSACSALNRSGIPVLVMATNGSAHARYRYNHAKYVVIDGEGLLVSTENFGLHGYPPAGSRGNRGWGAFIEDPGTAGYFQGVFSADRSGGDILPFVPRMVEPSVPSLDPYQAQFPPVRVTGVSVTPVLSPDTSSLVLTLLSGARERIEIEQASIRNSSGMEPDPFLGAALAAARRGVAVRILLDGSRFNDEGEADNDEMADLVNGIARREGLSLEARILEPAAGNLESVHTKGVIVDGRSVLISSINWNANSPNFNREAGVILESPALADYYTSVFEEDWGKAGAASGGPDPVRLAVAGFVLVLLAVYYLKRRR